MLNHVGPGPLTWSWRCVTTPSVTAGMTRFPPPGSLGIRQQQTANSGSREFTGSVKYLKQRACLCASAELQYLRYLVPAYVPTYLPTYSGPFTMLLLL